MTPVYTGKQLKDTPGSNLSPEVGVPHLIHLIPSETAQASKGPGQQKGQPRMLVYTVKNNRCCRAGCGKFNLRNANAQIFLLSI